ncbi:MAG TPA: amidohydrolase family protein [Chloroflexota bacterium]|nr:amidohydrolase family protein [Chloroflexota bacterium]
MSEATERTYPVALPPDPNTRPPHWRLPANACDSHIHVFGPPDVFPYAESRRYTPPAAPIEHYRNVQQITGLTRAVVVQPTAHGVDNRAIVNAVTRSAGTMRGIANIDDSISDAQLDELAARGVMGARFSLMGDREGSPDDIASQLPRMRARDWILDLHVDPDDLLEHEQFIRAIPLTIVVDHMARVRPMQGLDQPAFRVLLDLLKDDRFWVKICSLDKLSAVPKAHVDDGLPFRDMIPFAQAVIAAAPDRVLWGSDWPHGNTFTPGRTPNEGDLLDLLIEIAPDPATRQRILVDNPSRLFGFPPS